MTRARALDLVAFAAYFGIAAWLGRLTVLPDGDLALVWPAAGVAVAWMAVDGWSRWGVLDAVLVFVLSWLLNDLTGAGTLLALGLASATVLQVVVFGVLIAHWCPRWWGFGDEPPPGVEALRDLGFLIGAATLAAGASALVGPASVLSISDTDWTQAASWVLRNATGIIAIFPLSLLARHAVRSGDPLVAPTPVGPMRGLGPIELVALVVVTVAAAWGVLVVNTSLPIPFLLLATSVWAGARFSPGVSDAHALLLSAGVVAATVTDVGPFDAIADSTTRAIVVQAYVAVVVVLTLALTVGRREALLLTRRLARSEAASGEQATLLRTILDSMADGVTVLEGSGRLVLRNPAASVLVGTPRLDDAGRLIPRDEEVVALDGRTVGGPDGLLSRVLAGESIAEVDVFVRNPELPEGRTLAVTARPVADADPMMTVLVFHDVTADRRQRDELASFAGIVAHDLLNPLTVVEGWSEALLEPARAGVAVPPERQVDQLERIQRAAQRMQHLISDLLAFTTARDISINPVPVDPAAVAADVARARVDAARVQGDPVPIIDVRQIPPVLAEPVLLRQVVDNLVGNAVKYVAPGVVPEVCVSGSVVAVGDDAPMVEIRVTDNGIGIPADQRASVFDSFHRAHRDGGYRGTGLGLSIVKRVAERHGGTAWAAPHEETGGTAMCVTFPAA